MAAGSFRPGLSDHAARHLPARSYRLVSVDTDRGGCVCQSTGGYQGLDSDHIPQVPRNRGEVSKRTGVTQLPVVMDSLMGCATRLPAAELDGQPVSKHITWINHSSASTGHPVPIYQTHSGALKDFTNNFCFNAFIIIPLFHAHGLSCLFRAVHARKLIYMYNSSLPLTATFLLATLHDHPDIQALYAVPYALKLFSDSEDGLQRMARLELVMFTRSSCPKPIGDTLVQNGVPLVSHCGITETGQLMTSFRERSDWDYARPSSSLLPYLPWEQQPGMPGIYEPSMLEGWPSKLASNRLDNSYAT